MQNPHARAMVQWFIDHGHRAGRENGPYDAVLFGPSKNPWNQTLIDHSDHAHSSIYSIAMPKAPEPIEGEALEDAALSP
jgi:hypothetical protein